MRKAWLWIVLIVSLVANIGFIGGYAGATLQHKEAATPAGALQILAARLDFTASQTDALKRHRSAAARQRHVLEKAGQDDVQTFWAELLEDKPDRERLRTLAQAAADRQTAFTLNVAEELHTFMTMLKPDQRQAFADLIRNRPIFQGRFLMTIHRAGEPGA